jgi:hypothetical protein
MARRVGGVVACAKPRGTYLAADPHRLVQPHFWFWHVTESGVANNRIGRISWKNV